MLDLFSLFDRKLKQFGAPVQGRNSDEVKRALIGGIKGSGSLVEKYPADFDMYRVGFFDPETGEIVPIGTGAEFLFGVADVLTFPNHDVE